MSKLDDDWRVLCGAALLYVGEGQRSEQGLKAAALLWASEICEMAGERKASLVLGKLAAKEWER